MVYLTTLHIVQNTNKAQHLAVFMLRSSYPGLALVESEQSAGSLLLSSSKQKPVLFPVLTIVRAAL